MSDKRITRIIQGVSISPGLAEGIVHVHDGLLGPIDVPEDKGLHDVDEEFSRLDVATMRISDDLFTLARTCYSQQLNFDAQIIRLSNQR